MSKKEKERISTSFSKTIKETLYFLAILFCAFRACGIINWNWFWIMSPIFSWIIALVLFAVTGIIAFAAINNVKKGYFNGYQTKSR